MTKKTTALPIPSQSPPYSLRMPAELREKLEVIAKEQGRSLNAEIVLRLEQSVAPCSVDSEAVAKKTLDDIGLVKPDEAAIAWAAHLQRPTSRIELEALLTVISRMLRDTGRM